MVKICHSHGDRHFGPKAGGDIRGGRFIDRFVRHGTYPGGWRPPGVTGGRLELYYCQEVARWAMREISTTRTRGMPKALCMSGLVVAGLVIILFAADLAVGIPFRRASVMMDVSLLASAALLGLISWFTLR